MIIRNVTVIGDGHPSTGTEVVVADGVFSAIRPVTGERPAIDGHGGYLVPGLWESHTHLTSSASKAGEVSRPLAEYLAAGITSVVDLGGPLDIARAHRENPSDRAARPFFAGPVFTGIHGWPVLDDTRRDPLAHQVDDPDRAYALALGQADEVDFIKCTYDGEPGAPDKLPLEALRAIVTAAHEKGRKVLVHVHLRGDVEDAVSAGADGIEHAFLPQNPHSTREAADMAALLAETGTYYCPTLAIFEQLARNGDPAYLDELVEVGINRPEDIPRITQGPLYGRPFPRHPAGESRIRFDYALRTLGLMYDAGVKIAAGSDIAILMGSRPSALFRELQLLAKAGLPPHAVLAACTRHAAAKIGQDANVGTITPGAAADALLLDADPRTDLAHLIDPSHRLGTLRNGQLS